MNFLSAIEAEHPDLLNQTAVSWLSHGGVEKWFLFWPNTEVEIFLSKKNYPQPLLLNKNDFGNFFCSILGVI